MVINFFGSWEGFLSHVATWDPQFLTMGFNFLKRPKGLDDLGLLPCLFKPPTIKSSGKSRRISHDKKAITVRVFRVDLD